MTQLQIETTTRCNARCVFCPHPTMRRRKEDMERGLFSRIVGQIRSMPEVTDVSLQGLGEPLLDPLIAERIAEVRAQGAGLAISLYTNGRLLTSEKAAAIFAAGLDQLVISLNATSAAERQATMGLTDWPAISTLLPELIRLHGPRIRVHGVGARDLMADPRAFAQSWGQSGGLFAEGNWAGATRAFRGAPQTAPCSRALGQIMVLVDGRVAICCFDAEGSEILGDLVTTPLREVWQGERARAIRALHREGKRCEIGLCKGCTMI